MSQRILPLFYCDSQTRMLLAISSGTTEAELASRTTEESQSRIRVFSTGSQRCVADGAAYGSVRATAALPGPAGDCGSSVGRLG